MVTLEVVYIHIIESDILTVQNFDVVETLREFPSHLLIGPPELVEIRKLIC